MIGSRMSKGVRILGGIGALVVLVVACALPGTRDGNGSSADVAEVAAILSGRFSSAAQAEADPEYFAIRLTHVPIWRDRDDGPWLYVEQAAESSLDRPYRQRVYHLVAVEGGVRSDIYTLPGDVTEFVGADAAAFAHLGPDSLELRDGCAIHLSRTSADHYAGATRGQGCTSTLRGASYATSGVTVLADRLVTWDRGFDDAGAQVWGAVDGPYVFVRVGE